MIKQRRFEKLLKTILFLVAATMLSATSFAARVNFTIAMDPDQSGGGARAGQGVGHAVLDLSDNTLRYYFTFTGLSGSQTAAHIHGPAAPGASGGVLYNTGVGSPKSATITLTDPGSYPVADQIDDLLHGLWYVNVHSTTFGGGEIRGQIYAVDPSFTLTLDAAQSGGGARTGSGSGVATLDLLNDQFSYTASYSGMSGTETAAHFHGPAAVGVNAGVMYATAVGSPKDAVINLTAGTYSIAEQVDHLLNDLWYLNVHTTTFAGGEIRGQVLFDTCISGSDFDCDGTDDGSDAFPWDPNETLDTDSDTIGDNADNCIFDANQDQSDTNGNGIGDLCDATRAADTDGDNISDILWQKTSTGEVLIWHQENFSKTGETNVGAFAATHVLADTADLDADGDSDLILFNGDPAVGQAIRWEMEGHSKVAGALLAGFPGWQFKGTGDVDGDGDGDIIWQNEDGGATTDGLIVVWIMENLTKQSGSSLGRHEFGARVEAIGDFDNDGDADILQSIPSGPTLIRWDFENGSKVAGSSIGGFIGYTVKAVGDFNGDTTDDVLWEPDGAGQAIMWLMQNGDKDTGTGVGLLTNYDIETVGDYDGDGDYDVLWKNANGNVILWEIQNAAKVSGQSIGALDNLHDIKP